MADLKPCPFCGKEIEWYSVEMNKYGIDRLQIDCCVSFDIRSDHVMYTDDDRFVRDGLDAIEKWNRRVNDGD